MVKKWQKQLNLIAKSDHLELQSIIDNILTQNFDGYDIRKLSGYRYLYRARVGKYRIIFQKNKNVKILKIDTRGGVYKGL